MTEHLKIEVRAKNNPDILKLLKHIYAQVANEDNVDLSIESKSKVNGPWIDVESLGSYSWIKK